MIKSLLAVLIIALAGVGVSGCGASDPLGDEGARSLVHPSARVVATYKASDPGDKFIERYYVVETADVDARKFVGAWAQELLQSGWEFDDRSPTSFHAARSGVLLSVYSAREFSDIPGPGVVANSFGAALTDNSERRFVVYVADP